MNGKQCEKTIAEHEAALVIFWRKNSQRFGTERVFVAQTEVKNENRYNR